MPSRRPLPRPAAPGPGRWYGLSPPHGTSCPWAPSVQSGRPYAASRLCGISLESTSPPKPLAGNASAESASISPFRGVVLRNRRRDRNVIQPERRGRHSAHADLLNPAQIGYARGRARLRLLSLIGFPQSARVLDWPSSRFPTDHVAWPKSLPCPRRPTLSATLCG